MRRLRLLLVTVVLLCGLGLGPAHAVPALKVTVGYDGYFRARTLVPIRVDVDNGSGDTVKGALHLTTEQRDVLTDTVTTEVTIPRGGQQTYTLYVIPERFARVWQVTLVSRGREIAAASYDQAKELYDPDRLLVVVGGQGASFSYLNGQKIFGATPAAWRSWGVTSAKGGAPAAPGQGSLHVVYQDARTLPANPEAYGSIGTLALMADVTAQMLPREAQQAIPEWVASGGQVLIAGGGVASRFDAEPFTRLLPVRGGQPLPGTESLTTPDGGAVHALVVGTGRVIALDDDPDSGVPSSHAAALASFYADELIARMPRTPLAQALQSDLDNATMVRELKPPDIRLLIIFLVIYLVVLVPLNYAILKRLDKRELAWITTPLIVVVFTVGAYAIGAVTKGHRLVTNVVTVVETAAGQPSALATSRMLIFSPSRTAYRLRLGDSGLLVRETAPAGAEAAGLHGMPYEGFRQPQGLACRVTENREWCVDRLNVNMWDFRQFALVHRMDLGSGITSTVTTGKTAADAAGTVTNGTPYRFAVCDLFLDGTPAGSFSLAPGATVTVAPSAPSPDVVLSPDQQSILTRTREAIARRMGDRTARGVVLVAYTGDDAARVPVCIDDRAPSAALAAVVVHLEERTPTDAEGRGLWAAPAQSPARPRR